LDELHEMFMKMWIYIWWFWKSMFSYGVYCLESVEWA